MVADGFCDDDTNNLACDFDGGDCCGLEVLEAYCDDCDCHEDWHEEKGQSLLLVFKAKLILQTNSFKNEPHVKSAFQALTPTCSKCQ